MVTLSYNNTMDKEKARQAISKGQEVILTQNIGKNARITKYKNGDKIITLYQTDILIFKGDKLILNSGGFRTKTTKRMINSFLSHNILVYAKNFEWYIHYKGQEVEFFDGIELTV